ncbi:MAG: hypothetical protein H6728_17105 [Myxococcales bacterium]|nr:hypothetical protein [Myxococcales bacterium]MCB9644793.1 hypothetical protein [Myxococcales bacterium]
MLRRPKQGQLESLLEKWRPEMDALDADSLEHPAFSGARAEALTEGLVRHFVTITPLALKNFERQQWKEYGGVWISMHDRLWLFVAAEKAFLEALGEQAAEYSRLLEEVGGRMQGLMPWARVLAQVDADIAETLADLQRPRDLRDPADEAIRLVSLLRANQDLLGQALCLPEDALLALDQAAEALLQVLDEASIERLSFAQNTMFRAYTIWVRSYRLLASMGRFLQRDQFDIESKFPEAAPTPIHPVDPQ